VIINGKQNKNKGETMTCQPVVGGYKCEKDKIITISSPLDPSNPLTEHIWTIDGTQESTAASFQKTYAAPGYHTVVHSGKNVCLAECSQSAQLEITDVITPPPPSAAAAAPKGVSPLVVAAVVALGFLGIVMMKKK